MKVIKKLPLLVRFKDLKPGDTFDACGDVAIKTVDERGVVLANGSYVHRDGDDLVPRVESEVRWRR